MINEEVIEQTVPVSEEPTTLVESSKEQNLRILRERAEAAERRALELERAMAAQKPQVQEQEELEDVQDDDYLNGKKYKKYYKGLKEELRATRDELKQYMEKASLSSADLKLRAQFSDFEQVVNDENIRKFASLYPEDYETLRHNPDIYAKGKTVYNMIKNYGITKNYKEVDKKLEDNRNRPKSAASASPQSADTPLTRVGDFDRRVLTEDDKTRLRREMAQYRR